MSAIILQCDTCPTTFTTDRNSEVGVHWNLKHELLEMARKAGWAIEGENHRCAECTQRALDRKRVR